MMMIAVSTAEFMLVALAWGGRLPTRRQQGGRLQQPKAERALV
jgi:hypothetical protein